MAIGAEVNGKLIHESEASQRKAAQARTQVGIGESDDKQAEQVAEPLPVAQVNRIGE
jgi:hypothetical protein